MAKYGAKYIRWAPKTEGGYGSAIALGKLIKVTDAPKFAEGKLYADNTLAEYAAEFVEADIDVEVSDVPTAAAAAIFGATTDEQGNVHYGSEDSAPNGGLGFVSCKVVDGTKSFVGVFYPVVKGVLDGDEYQTKGDSITFSTGKLKLKASAENTSSDWKVESKALQTEEAAKAWVDAQLG